MVAIIVDLLIDWHPIVLFVVLNKLLELLWLVFIQPGWVIAPVVVVSPLFVDILVSHKVSHLEVARIGAWLLVVTGEVLLPVGVDHVVAQMLEQIDLAIRPFVKVDRFDFSDVNTKLTMNAYTTQSD